MPSPPAASLHFSFDDKSGPIRSPDSSLDSFLSSPPLSLLGVLDVKETTKALPKLEGKPGALLQRALRDLVGRSFRVSHVSGDDELKVFAA